MSITPEAHSSLVGGSTAARRINCPASYALEKKVPKSPGGKAARAGTAMHELMAKLLLDPDLEVYSILPFEYKDEEGWSHTIHEEDWERQGRPAMDALMDYFDAIEAETGADVMYLVEQRVEFPAIEGAFGTADVIWWSADQAGVWDWKFGHYRVPAEENSQLLFYLCGARAAVPQIKAATRLHLAIMQPACGDDPDVWDGADQEHLNAFEKELLQAVNDAEEHGEQARMEIGDHCRYAPCKAICPLHLKGVTALGEQMKRAQTNRPPDHDTIEKLPHLVELAHLAKDWANELLEYAREMAEADPAVRNTLSEGGWHLVPKKAGPRTWGIDVDALVNRLRYRGLKSEDIYEKKVRSVAQIERRLKDLGYEVEDDWLADRTSSGYNLTRKGRATVEENGLDRLRKTLIKKED